MKHIGWVPLLLTIFAAWAGSRPETEPPAVEVTAADGTG